MMLQQLLICFNEGCKQKEVSKNQILFVLLRIMLVQVHINQPYFTRIAVHPLSIQKKKDIRTIIILHKCKL